jgi:hypothetical protein
VPQHKYFIHALLRVRLPPRVLIIIAEDPDRAWLFGGQVLDKLDNFHPVAKHHAIAM